MATVATRTSARKPNDTPLSIIDGQHTIRMTPDGRAVAIDVLAWMGQKDPSAAWRNVKAAHPDILEDSSRFPFGHGGRPPEVLTEHGVYKLIMVSGGTRAVEFRKRAADLIARYRRGELAGTAPAPSSDLAERQFKAKTLQQAIRARKRAGGLSKEVEALLMTQVAEIALGQALPELRDLPALPEPKRWPCGHHHDDEDFAHACKWYWPKLGVTPEQDVANGQSDEDLVRSFARKGFTASSPRMPGAKTECCGHFHHEQADAAECAAKLGFQVAIAHRFANTPDAFRWTPPGEGPAPVDPEIARQRAELALVPTSVLVAESDRRAGKRLRELAALKN